MNSYRDVLIYVEGPSDVEGLKVLLDDLIDEKDAVEWRSGLFHPAASTIF